jgi:glutamine amidotransferase
MRRLVTIIDYGMGNIWSVQSAFEFLGCDVVVSDDRHLIERAETLVLPGVGSLRSAMESLRSRELDQAILTAVGERGSKILGICLGMQILADYGSEDGGTSGLGLIPTSVERFSSSEVGFQKIPHVGFNRVTSPEGTVLFKRLGSAADFYFVHSFRIVDSPLPGLKAMCRYGNDFVAGWECGTVFAVQFHPEKSQTNGLILLENFLDG